MYVCYTVMLLIQQCFTAFEMLGFLGVVPQGEEEEKQTAVRNSGQHAELSSA